MGACASSGYDGGVVGEMVEECGAFEVRLCDFEDFGGGGFGGGGAETAAVLGEVFEDLFFLGVGFEIGFEFGAFFVGESTIEVFEEEEFGFFVGGSDAHGSVPPRFGSDGGAGRRGSPVMYRCSSSRRESRARNNLDFTVPIGN